jgi:hypothetical protein
VLTKGQADVGPGEQYIFRKGVGKLIHLQKWSRPDIINATRDLARFMGCPTKTHMKALVRAMSYIVQTPERGLVLQPDTGWGGFAEHEFVIVGRCDASYHTCPDTVRSVSGWSVFLHGASTENKSKIQSWVTLSVTEAELVSATTCAQSLLFHYRLLSDLGLRVKLPMILEMDNKGPRDLVCNWSAGGRLRHVDIRQFFLRDLKEDGLVWTIWIPTKDNSADVFTKNLSGPLFEKHIRTYVGFDQHMQHELAGTVA